MSENGECESATTVTKLSWVDSPKTINRQESNLILIIEAFHKPSVYSRLNIDC